MRTLYKKGVIFHILFWFMYAFFMIYETKPYAEVKGWWYSMMSLGIYFVLMALLVYVNIYFLMPRLLERKKILCYFIAVFVLMILYTIARSINQRYWDILILGDQNNYGALHTYFFWNAVYAVWFTIISSMLYFTIKSYSQSQQVKNIEISHLQTELKYLRAQVNPHFLFNGLNTIYGSIDKSNQQARDILLQFSDLLRYNLYEADVDYLDLNKEALYLENYVALQKARSNSNLHVRTRIEVSDGSIKIAPLLFLPFVENAFKFASTGDNTDNSISILLQQKGREINFECSNSYENAGTQEGGIGLSNVKRRLELLYKGQYKIDISKSDKLFSVNLKLVL